MTLINRSAGGTALDWRQPLRQASGLNHIAIGVFELELDRHRAAALEDAGYTGIAVVRGMRRIVNRLQETVKALDDVVTHRSAVRILYWMQQSGLVSLLPSLCKAVYVGVSAGSMVMAPNIGEDFVNWRPPTGGDSMLGLLDFAIFPHVDHEKMPDNSMANPEKWAAGVWAPAYAFDDQTAYKVTDGVVEAVSEGQWKRFTP
jgi:hypothetical protein